MSRMLAVAGPKGKESARRVGLHFARSKFSASIQYYRCYILDCRNMQGSCNAAVNHWIMHASLPKCT